MRLYTVVTLTFGTLAVVAVVAALGLLAGLASSGGRSWLRSRLGGLERHPLGWAAFASLLAMAGSLYLSDWVGLTPCKLCWFQRIAMYPLPVLLGLAAFRHDPGIWRYALPLSVVGLGISIYHVAVQILPSPEAATCQGGVPCSAVYVEVFGFVTIPVMAGAVFLLVSALLLVVRSVSRPVA